jgi:Family of unknown function (DUF5996)
MSRWPELTLADWEDTRLTFHMWTQVVGKVRLALEPRVNHSWQVPFYVSARGLTTSLLHDTERSVELEFDLLAHQLVVDTTDGDRRTVALEPRTVASFYDETMAALGELGVDVKLFPRPVEVPVAVPFAKDTEHRAYDRDAIHRFWLAMVQADRLLDVFRARFIGKASPVHFFWGGLDLATTRFSGRTAPPHPGGVPNCPDWVMLDAYSHEVSSCGYWPGGSEEGSFYAYAYPEPPGFSEWAVPEGAYYDTELREFILPYQVLRTAGDPDALLLDFLQASYEAAAVPGGWDRDALEAGLEGATGERPPARSRS